MTQYMMVFFDDSIEYIEAYDVQYSDGRAVFDLGRGRTAVYLYVKSVEALALA